MSLFSKKPAFLLTALAAAGISTEQVDAAYAAGNTDFLVGESATRDQLAADLATKDRLLQARDATLQGAATREAALAAALGALGIKPEDLLAEGADPAALAKAALKTAAAREAAETLSKHGIKPIAGASAAASTGADGKPEPITLDQYRALEPWKAAAFFKAGGTLVD
jgi:hypothetical protein